jgi:hypothetical protein
VRFAWSSEITFVGGKEITRNEVEAAWNSPLQDYGLSGGRLCLPSGFDADSGRISYPERLFLWSTRQLFACCSNYESGMA